MTHQSFASKWQRVLGVALVLSAVAVASDRQTVTDEFHQTYTMAAHGRVGLENINGPVHISSWDRNEVKVDAIKRGRSKERMDEVKITVDASSSRVSIRTEYPHHDNNFWNENRHDEGVSVEYTLLVPRDASLDEIKLVNGGLDLRDIGGDVNASCVNGKVEAENLRGRIRMNSVNGELNASIGQLSSSPVELSSVNGALRVTLPSDAKADIEATTISGNISNDFGLRNARHQFVGSNLRGELGGGGTHLRLSNVNGQIEIRHANDNRPMSPAKTLTESGKRDHDDDDDTI